MVPTILNSIILILEIIMFAYIIPRYKWKLLKFYTMLSNIAAAIASAVWLVFGSDCVVASSCRFVATSMLTLTCLVAILVLIPMGSGVKGILWVDCGLVFHLIVPVLSFVSFEFYEKHPPMGYFILPLIVTMIYGAFILLFVITDKITRPYPFLDVKKQSIPASVFWIVLMLGVVTAVSYAILAIG